MDVLFACYTRTHQVIGSKCLVAVWNPKPHQSTVPTSIYYMPLVHHVLGMDFYLSQNFVPSCIGHLEKFWFTEFAGLPKADTFHYPILKMTHSLISLPISLKSLKTLEALKFMPAITLFPNF